jgi:hypothetical protein
MGEKVFQIGHGLGFTADSHDGAGDSFGGLFTLITVHGFSPWLGWVK